MPTAAKEPEVVLFRALGDATRLAILRALASGPMTVKEVAATVGRSQPITTNHLIILKRVGLVKDTPDGFPRIQELVVPFHERMLAILSQDDCATWFDTETKFAELHAILKPYQAELMQVSKASTLVNSPKDEGPELLEPTA